MSVRTSITLSSEAHSFLQSYGCDNKSQYINALILEEKHRRLEQAVIQANQEEAEDASYAEELALWDATLADGLESPA